VKFFEIIRPGTKIDFITYFPRWVSVSIGIIVAGAIYALVFGVKVGVDFAGGTEAHVRFSTASSEAAVRGALVGTDLPGLSVIRYGEATDYLVRFEGDRKIGTGPTGEALTPQNDRVIAMQETLRQKVGELQVERVEFVGPKAGAELRNAGLKALVISFVLILIYVWFRFSLAFAPGAVIALVHDVLVTSAIMCMLGREFDLTVVAALLALVGYSINDTIIVYDRIRETLEYRGHEDLPAVINEAVNHTLSRTVITSGVTMLSVLALLALGGPVVRNFSLAMTIGIVVGTYSSIYIASPIAIVIDRRQRSQVRAGAPPTKPSKRSAGESR
jgi:preprotein translocase subunit SecF